MRAVEDPLVLELLRAQRPPPTWAVYRVFLHTPHLFKGQPGSSRCEVCGATKTPHLNNEQLRTVILMKNGPLRHVSLLADDEEELPTDARKWLNTLYNLCEASGVRLDGWLAYDARG